MPGSTYRDFELLITKQETGSDYAVWARLAVDDLSGSGELHLPYGQDEIVRALTWMEEGIFDEEKVRQFGADLFQSLFVGPIHQVYQAARQRAGSSLRLRLIIDAPEVARVPWELLFDPDRRVFLALEAPLVRGLSLVEPVHPFQVEPPIRVLVLQASPRGVPALDGSLEQTGIVQQLAGLGRRRRAQVTILHHATLRSLQNALREAKEAVPARSFHVLHFIGHGATDSVTGQQVLLFENDTGDVDLVQPEALADILRPYDLRLVFLNACQSLRSSAVDMTQGFAPALLSSGVPAVVGMQVAVLDQVARQFSNDFYAALADNQPVDQALVDARQLARGAGRQTAALGIPVCYLRSASGQIMEIVQPGPGALSLETWRGWLRARLSLGNLLRRSWWLVGAIATVLGLVLGIPALLSLLDGLPMTGHFNIAVPKVSAAVRSSVLAGAAIDDLSAVLFEAVDSQAQVLRDQDYDIQVREPTRVSRIKGAGATERQASAAELANKIDADLVIYGYLIVEPDRTSYATELYLSDRTLEGADEAAGPYPFGDPIEVDGNVVRNPVASRELEERVAARAVALAHMAVGLGHYARGEYQEAAQVFGQASRLLAPADISALRVIYLFLGTTAAKLEDLPAARKYYELSLERDSTYARAKLGLAQVLFLENRRDCQRGNTEVQALQAALAGYEEATRLPADPTSETPITAALFGGNVKLCLSQAQAGDYWDDALDDFKLVVDEFDRRAADSTEKQRIKYLAAEAYRGMGLIHRWRRVGANGCATGDDLAEAQTAFDKATGLSREPDRQAVDALHLTAIHLCRLECRTGLETFQRADTTYRRFQDDNPKVSNLDFKEFRDQLLSNWPPQCPKPTASSQPN